jgi:tetratricopeptide (TPR) repeat protein
MKVTRLLILVLAAGTLAAQVRLDGNKMRNDLFAAMAGNADALKRIIDSSEKMLTEHPDHAQAMMWHGIGVMGSFFQEAQKGNVQAAFPNFLKGAAEMDRAADLAPDDIEVRVLRGVLYRPASREVPPQLANGLLEKARTDFQHTFDLQKDHLAELGTHPLGELLQGLADIYSRQGKAADAEKYYGMMQSMLKDTEYAKRASEWMITKQPLPESRTQCVGCHMGR